jgi:hypothetical protein
MAPHRHVVVDVTVTSGRTNTNVPRIVARRPLHGSLALGAQHGKLDADLRTSALLGTPSVQSVHYYYPFAMEDGGRLAPMAAELVDRLAISVAVRRFPGMGAAESRSLRSDNYVRMQHIVRRTTYVPFRRFSGDVRHDFMQRLYVALHDTLGTYLRDAFQEGSVDAVAYLHVPRALVFSSFHLFAWWLPLLFLVRNCHHIRIHHHHHREKYSGCGYDDTSHAHGMTGSKYSKHAGKQRKKRKNNEGKSDKKITKSRTSQQNSHEHITRL